MRGPFSDACERNKAPIFEVLKDYLLESGRLFEVGSGTGQHSIYICQKMPKLHWVTSDLVSNLEGLKYNLKEAKLSNIHGPEKFELPGDDFPSKRPFDYVFTANTLHIMSWKNAKTLFKLVGKRLREGCLFFIYGPFKYNGLFTSESNELFDQSLKLRDPQSGIRNFEDIKVSLEKYGFKLLKDHEMPAYNHLLVFEKNKFPI